MAKKLDMEEAFKTLPKIPEHFEQYCLNRLPRIPIFYKWRKETAECLCGKCGMTYETRKLPIRHEFATCHICGNKGRWEWSKVTTWNENSDDITLIQCTTDNNLVIRIFTVYQAWQQGCRARIECKERRRYFLFMGDVYKFYNATAYTSAGWARRWGTESDHEVVNTDELYPGWRNEIVKSNLKYCDPEKIAHITRNYRGDIVRALLVYANNPAVEMYEKSGMKGVVGHLFMKEGKTSLINRRSKTLYGQLRIKDKAALNRLVKMEGDVYLLQILQMEKKNNIYYTTEQELFLTRRYHEYKGRENTDFLLRYMSLQKLMNRVEKYKQQGDYGTEGMVIGAYVDYLEMRKELGYDMTNEVYLYPKNLKEKHDQMVSERNNNRDKLHSQKMQEKYPKIKTRYEKILKKYGYEDENYVIRPAMDAAEIVAEGRILHHCVGREWYLEKHNKGDSFILFLRKKETPDVPYYTIEIRDNKIVQWYGLKDKKPDQEIIGPWLDNYVEMLTNGTLRKTQELLMAAV